MKGQWLGRYEAVDDNGIKSVGNLLIDIDEKGDKYNGYSSGDTLVRAAYQPKPKPHCISTTGPNSSGLQPPK